MNKPSGRLLVLLLLTFGGALSGACAGPAGVIGPPTAAEILKKPATAGYKDAHFTLKIHTSSGAFTIDLTGDGTVVRKPTGEQMHYQGSLGAIPLAFDFISVGGKEYSRTGAQKWTVKDAASNLSPEDWSKASNSKLVGEEMINGAKAWHVTATPTSGVLFDLWVRESDGYPLKFISNGSANGTSPSPAATSSSATAAGTFEMDFDKFNTGVKIQPPPASDVKPPAQNVTAKVGAVMHLNVVDLTVASANLDAKSPNEFDVPKAGNRFVSIEVLYVLTGSDPVHYNPFDWKIADSKGFNYDSRFGGLEPALHSGTLSSAGEKVRGFVTFEVPTAANGLMTKVTIGDDSAQVALS